MFGISGSPGLMPDKAAIDAMRKALFAKADTDKDGKLSADELQAALQSSFEARANARQAGSGAPGTRASQDTARITTVYIGDGVQTVTADQNTSPSSGAATTPTPAPREMGEVQITISSDALIAAMLDGAETLDLSEPSTVTVQAEDNKDTADTSKTRDAAQAEALAKAQKALQAFKDITDMLILALDRDKATQTIHADTKVA